MGRSLIRIYPPAAAFCLLLGAATVWLPGLKRLQRLDGGAVNFIDENTFQIIATEQIVTSDRGHAARAVLAVFQYCGFVQEASRLASCRSRRCWPATSFTIPPPPIPGVGSVESVEA